MTHVPTGLFLLPLIGIYCKLIWTCYWIGVFPIVIRVNLRKSVYISFRNTVAPEDESITYIMGDYQLEPKYSSKVLGLTITEDLDWSLHHDNMISGALRCLGLLRRLFSHTSSSFVKKQLYLTLVRPKLMYCTQIWRPQQGRMRASLKEFND